MKILIIGGSGMLGHKLWQSYQDRFETWATIRSLKINYEKFGIYQSDRLLAGVDGNDMDSVVQALAVAKPEVVINCIGIIKQSPSAHDPIVSLTINSLFPHRLAKLCQVIGARLVHISTDCVFSGSKGMYTEADVPDGEHLYGRSKFMGEVNAAPHLTLRTSIIGRELQSYMGLIEWFMSNQGGQVRGYNRAIYSGFTTLALAQVIGEIIERHPGLSGLYQVSSAPINKYDLLCLVRDKLGVKIEIEPYADFQIDRSLDSSRFWAEIGMNPPTWQEMIQEMADDPTPYNEWKNS